MPSKLFTLTSLVATAAILFCSNALLWAQDLSKQSPRERARSDSDAPYLHHILLYDVDNRKITPESNRPYSPKNTCGRCHDYSTISHGWHFNAFTSDGSDEVGSPSGRAGEPWIWTDPRTATQLPLTYRNWEHSYNPDDIGISPFAMTAKFGGRIPGGGLGEPTEPASDADEPTTSRSPRWDLAGALEIDCLACHATIGAYDINQRREQVEKQNFAFAPTAAMRWGEISGDVSRLKDDADPEDEATKKKLPTVSYDDRQFSPDGTVFIDLRREPSSEACYQCHSQRKVSSDEEGSFVRERWIHDEDVHLMSGMDCVDCHRNGIDHDMVRGFKGQQAIDGTNISTLTCEGCHLGTEADEQPMGELSMNSPNKITLGSGRLGSPKPLHEGLPPIHFEKMTCTACHGGPAPRQEAMQIMTSLAHGLGEKGHRTGEELPAIIAPIYTRDSEGKIAPHKAMWPAFWGMRSSESDAIKPLDPDFVFETARKKLRIRRDFVEELLRPDLKSSQLAEILGKDRAKSKRDQWTAEERQAIESKQSEFGKQAFNEKVYDALIEIETKLEGDQAVFVSSGIAYVAAEQEGSLDQLDLEDDQAVQMIQWPMAHNVRPAGWSLGVKGCTECHADEGLIFASTVATVGPVKGDAAPVKMASLQGLNEYDSMAWNQLFSGRASFKYFIAGVLGLVFLMLIFSAGQLFGRRSARYEGGDAR